jgi:hypothetical protein
MRRLSRGFLITVSALNGAAGLICGLMLIAKPDGSLLQMGALVPVMRALPLADVFFRDFAWLGVAMLVALATPNLTALVMLVRRNANQYIATLVSAILLIAWCGFELMYMFNFAAVGYLVVAVLSLVASMMLRRPAAEAGA